MGCSRWVSRERRPSGPGLLPSRSRGRSFVGGGVVAGQIPKKTRAFVLNRHNHLCALCGKPEEFNDFPEDIYDAEWEPGLGPLELHHILPRADGGTNDPENLEPLHRACHELRHREIRDLRKATALDLLAASQDAAELSYNLCP